MVKIQVPGLKPFQFGFKTPVNFNSILNHFNGRNLTINTYAHEYNKIELAQTIKGSLIQSICQYYHSKFLIQGNHYL